MKWEAPSAEALSGHTKKGDYVHLSVNRIRVVQDVLERDVGVSESVREVLREDPSHVGVSRLLNGVTLAGTEERVVGKAVQERRFLDDLQIEERKVIGRWLEAIRSGEGRT